MRYELLFALGRGGMAELHLARLSGAGGFTRLVAIKRMLPHLAHDSTYVELFLNEAHVAARLSHPNVCQVHELCDGGGELSLVMEYLEGAALADLPCSDPAFVAGVIAQAAEGLNHAHARGVLHRDVSPQNLFVTADGCCKVLDFGVAKLDGGPCTRTGVLKGKLAYMAPEQVRGEPLDARCDVFALGVVAWEALTGERLFARDADYLTCKAIDEEPIPSVTSKRAALPPELDAVLARALARDRERRYASVRDFAAALTEAAGGAFDAARLAAVVQSTCGVRLAERAAAIRGCRVPTRVTVADVAATMAPRQLTVIVKRRPARWRIALGTAIVAAVAGVTGNAIASRPALPPLAIVEKPVPPPPPETRPTLDLAIDSIRALEALRDR